MVVHWTTLVRVVEELRAECTGAVLERLLLRGRHELILLYRRAEQHGAIHVALSPGASALFRRPSAWGEPEGTAWAPMLWGAAIQTLHARYGERIVELRTSAGTLWLLLFGTAQSSAVLTDGSGKILAAAGARWRAGESFSPPQRPSRAWQEFPPETSCEDALARGAAALGKLYARELCRRCGIEPTLPLSELGEAHRERLRSAMAVLLEELLQSPKTYLLRAPDGAPVVSAIPLQELPKVVGVYASPSDALAHALRLWERWRKALAMAAALGQRLERLSGLVQQQIRQAQEHLQHAGELERYRHWGNLLLAQPGLHQRGMSQLCVRGWEGEQNCIPLKPERSLYENAQHFFQQARRLELSLERARQRLPQLWALQEQLQQFRAQLQQSRTERELRMLERQLEQLFPERERAIPGGGRVRVFTLAEGYVLYVGKDAESNERLTFGFARPHDLFLHARGVPGAHGILRGPHKGKLPPAHLLERAAAIVAYYSQARGSAMVPVAYTWRKYVRKLRKVPGAVRLEREEVVLVAPCAPAAEQSG